ncbi:MAG TPA: efflux RND transporter periplasmic adaptor subunit [Opitutaceae bacterium]|nr:efflux RND transporter periplasmic adaptor subunit [Opitutaceae bacterium]
MKPANLSQLRIDPAQKRRPRGTVKAIFIGVAVALIAAGYYAYPRPEKDRRVVGAPKATTTAGNPVTVPSKSAAAATSVPSADPQAEIRNPASLTVSGYIINRERIEISPRFQGVVAWLGVKKGDPVEKDQIVVRLEDAEQRANVATAEGRLAAAQVAVERAELSYRRIHDLYVDKVVSDDAEDEARLAVAAAQAALREAEGQLALARTYLEWTVIRSPISGVVLEKLAEPGELVTPQSFGGTRGPSTAVLAVADPRDLQVELDINETDLAKIALGDRCRVIPEAYPDKSYDGVVAEISPEANRQKGTLQIKVGIRNPDKHLTPELTAKVEFPRQ